MNTLCQIRIKPPNPPGQAAPVKEAPAKVAGGARVGGEGVEGAAAGPVVRSWAKAVLGEVFFITLEPRVERYKSL